LIVLTALTPANLINDVNEVRIADRPMNYSGQALVEGGVDTKRQARFTESLGHPVRHRVMSKPLD
jgi:hypothetical protein